jgi:hypothetical protein
VRDYILPEERKSGFGFVILFLFLFFCSWGSVWWKCEGLR